MIIFNRRQFSHPIKLDYLSPLNVEAKLCLLTPAINPAFLILLSSFLRSHALLEANERFETVTLKSRKFMIIISSLCTHFYEEKTSEFRSHQGSHVSLYRVKASARKTSNNKKRVWFLELKNWFYARLFLFVT